MPFVTQKNLQFKAWLQEETEATLIGSGLATQGQLRKLIEGQSFIDSNGQRWWKYRNEYIVFSSLWPGHRKKEWLYYSHPLPEEEPQPRPTDAVLGGKNAQPRPYDAVLGGNP